MKLSLLVVLVLMMASCMTTDNSSIDRNLSVTKKNPLIGKTIIFDYGESAYEIKITSADSLHWTLIKGQYSGPQRDDENYYFSRLSPQSFFISWIEKSGLGLYNVVNLETNELVTHARDEENTYINTGTVKFK